MKLGKIILTAALTIAGTCGLAQTAVIQVKSLDNHLWGYASLDGELLIPASYRRCFSFSTNGLALIFDDKDREYHLINLKNERIPTNYPVVKVHDGLGFGDVCFNSNLVPVAVADQWGYMNNEGKLVIPTGYTNAGDFNGGYATARKEKQFFILDATGKELAVQGDVVDMKDFSEGLAPYRTKDRKMGFMNTKGEIVIQAQFLSVGPFSNGLAWAKMEENKLGYIDQTGKWVIEPVYNLGREFDPVSGLARVKFGESWFYVKKDGTIVRITDTESFGDFSEGLAEGKKGGLRGFYNPAGEWVIKPQFEAVRDFKNGYAAAKLNDKWGLIDKQGNWKIQPTFEKAYDVVIIN